MSLGRLSKPHRRASLAASVVGSLALLACLPAAAAELDGASLLALAQRTHDPEGAWPEVCLELELRETRPEGEDRQTNLVLDVAGDRFVIEQRTGEGPVRRGVASGDRCDWALDGESDIPPAVREEQRLTCDRLRRVRDYYTYLWLLPMKLSDPGSLVDETVERGAFDDRPADILRVTYDPEVGGDVWLFYFEPESHHLMGARFYHDEAAGDGEAILMAHSVKEPETGLVIPLERAWFTNQGGNYLGTDILESVRTCR